MIYEFAVANTECPNKLLSEWPKTSLIVRNRRGKYYAARGDCWCFWSLYANF